MLRLRRAETTHFLGAIRRKVNVLVLVLFETMDSAEPKWFSRLPRNVGDWTQLLSPWRAFRLVRSNGLAFFELLHS
jgi:hypothetical protein